MLGAQLPREVTDFIAGQRSQRLFSPTSQRERDHPAYSWMQARDFTETFLDHPINLRIGKRARQIGDGRQVMDHIAHGREANKEDFFHAQDSTPQ